MGAGGLLAQEKGKQQWRDFFKFLILIKKHSKAKVARAHKGDNAALLRGTFWARVMGDTEDKGSPPSPLPLHSSSLIIIGFLVTPPPAASSLPMALLAQVHQASVTGAKCIYCATSLAVIRIH